MMFGMLSGVAGLTMMNPISLVLGLALGKRTYNEERDRQFAMRRQQAKAAVRRYVDEASFQVGNDSREALRRVQRQFRDAFEARANELQRTTAESLAAVQRAAQTSEEARVRRSARRRRRARARRRPRRAGPGARSRPRPARGAREPGAARRPGPGAADAGRRRPRGRPGRRPAPARVGGPRPAVARGDRGQGEGGEVDVAQRARRRGARTDRRGGVHEDRHLVRGRRHVPRHALPASTASPSPCGSGARPARSTSIWVPGRRTRSSGSSSSGPRRRCAGRPSSTRPASDR